MTQQDDAVETFDALGRAILPPEHFEISTDGVGLVTKGRAARSTDIAVPKLEQLNEMQSYAYTLTSDMAASLKIPTIASVSATHAKSVHVLEWAKFMDQDQEDGSVHRWGCAVRLCITVSKTQGQGSMSLPFLAAEAQLGQIEASWVLNVRGARGSKIEQKLLPPQNLDVKTYVLAEKALAELITLMTDHSTTLTPMFLQRLGTTPSPQAERRREAVRTFIILGIALGREEALIRARIPSGFEDLFTETMAAFGRMDSGTTDAGREAARAIIAGLDFRVLQPFWSW